MPCCAAWGCSNRTEHGVHLFGFPTDLQRRRIWEVKVGRTSWRSSGNKTKLCEAHFEEDQFKNDPATGKKKLRKGAVPSIFQHRPNPKRRRAPKGRSTVLEEVHLESRKQMVLIDHPYASLSHNKPQLAACDKDEPVHKTEKTSECGNNASTSKCDEKKEMDANPLSAAIQLEQLRYAKRSLNNRFLQTQKALRKVRREKKAIGKCKRMQELAYVKVFNPDQLNALSRKSTRGCKWSNATIKKALQIHFACGPTGYELLQKQHQPLPSLRTLRRKMQSVIFEPGILDEVFKKLEIKVKSMKDQERECCLTLDEMSITPSIEFDNSSGHILGNVTLPGHDGIASHGLVFMISGVTTRWKQVVAYHFTGSSYDGAAAKPIITDIIKKAHNIGLHVLAITSDMGSMNRAMWRSFGIICGKDCQTINKIPHPCNSNRFLYFLADVPHVLKNLKSALVNAQKIWLPSVLANTHGLSSTEVSVKPLKDLLSFQENKDLKLAPKLTEATLTPSHFEKMKVSHALNFFSNSVASALRYLVECEGHPKDILTTAWFLELCNRWFNLMSSRHPVMALSKMNPVQHKAAIECLSNMIKIFKVIKIGNKGAWKPVQTGVILSTQSILDIQEEILEQDHKFLLTSRFTQDCLENLFSSVRMKNPVPSPLEFRYALRIITVAQFLKSPQAGNYQEDDNEFLAEFNADTTPSIENDSDIPDVILNQEGSALQLSADEMNSLYYLVGYCITRLQRNDKYCPVCLGTVKSTTPSLPVPAKLTILKEYKEGCLVHPTELAFQYLWAAEKMFRKFSSDDLLSMVNTKKQITSAVDLTTAEFQFPDCHNIQGKLLSRFLNVRLHIVCKKLRAEVKKEIQNQRSGGELGSKSMAMRKLIKKVK